MSQISQAVILAAIRSYQLCNRIDLTSRTVTGRLPVAFDPTVSLQSTKCGVESTLPHSDGSVGSVGELLCAIQHIASNDRFDGAHPCLVPGGAGMK